MRSDAAVMKRQSHSLKYAAVVAGFAAAFLIGRWSVSVPKNNRENGGVLATRSFDAGLNRPIEQQTISPAFAGVELQGEAERLAVHAATEAPGLRRLTTLYTALDAIDVNNWRSVFEVLWKARRENLLSESELNLALQRIGQATGREGLSHFRPADPVNDYETHTARYAMQGWAEAAPAEAWAYIQEQPEGKFREGMITGYVWGVGANDTKAALDALDHVEPHTQASILSTSLGSANGAHYSKLAEQWLAARADAPDSGATSEQQNRVFSSLLQIQQQQGWDDPTGERIARWMEAFQGRTFVAANHVAAVAHQQAGSSPEAALGWIASFAGPDQRLGEGPTMQLMARLARTDLNRAAQWLDQNRENPHYDQAAAAFILTPGGTMDPETAETWLATIADEGIRERTARALEENQQRAAQAR
jgi:hypothetical protein